MPQREPSAAQALYGHLPHDDGRMADWATQRRARNDVAAAMFPSLVPKPKPEPERSHGTDTMSLAERADADPWLEYRLGLAGLKRRR